MSSYDYIAAEWSRRHYADDTMYMSSDYYMCVLILYMCPHTTICMSSYDYIYVLIRLYCGRMVETTAEAAALLQVSSRVLTYADVC
jgi:hypothetical protein